MNPDIPVNPLFGLCHDEAGLLSSVTHQVLVDDELWAYYKNNTLSALPNTNQGSSTGLRDLCFAIGGSGLATVAVLQGTRILSKAKPVDGQSLMLKDQVAQPDTGKPLLDHKLAFPRLESGQDHQQGPPSTPSKCASIGCGCFNWFGVRACGLSFDPESNDPYKKQFDEFWNRATNRQKVVCCVWSTIGAIGCGALTWAGVQAIIASVNAAQYNNTQGDSSSSSMDDVVPPVTSQPMQQQTTGMIPPNQQQTVTSRVSNFMFTEFERMTDAEKKDFCLQCQDTLGRGVKGADWTDLDLGRTELTLSDLDPHPECFGEDARYQKDYFEQFGEIIRVGDVMWTKPNGQGQVHYYGRSDFLDQCSEHLKTE